MQLISSLNMDVECENFNTYTEFIGSLNRTKFDLIVTDLMVPLFPDCAEEQDVSRRLIENVRDFDCPNFKTPVIAITKYDAVAESNFSDLNKYDITVITYEEHRDDWRNAFTRKIKSCIPSVKYEFVIVCALEKEAASYEEAGYKVSSSTSLHGMSCRTIEIEQKVGIIITPPRMGLVNSAILCSRAIDLFHPRLICMSGICAGIEGKANIYDVVIPEVCHQHDSGKWTKNGFVPEMYSIQLMHPTMLKIKEIISQKDFNESLSQGTSLAKNEFPSDENDLNFNVYLAPTSSGSAVVADETMLEEVKSQHRKMTAFEMESYALYESARQSLLTPIYFSAKSVVDNGDQNKSDAYHRAASLLSAKAVYEIIRRGILS